MEVGLKDTVAVFPLEGLKVYPAEDLSVLKVEPFVEPRTERVSVRVAHAAAGGSFSTRRPTVWAEPRSTVSDCGKALFVLSQYELASPSTALAAV